MHVLVVALDATSASNHQGLSDERACASTLVVALAAAAHLQAQRAIMGVIKSV